MDNSSDVKYSIFEKEIMVPDESLENFDSQKSIDVRKMKKCKIRRMYFAAFSALLFSLTMGLSSGYSAVATYDMKFRPSSVVKPTEKEIMWIGSTLALGLMLGGLMAGYLADKIGRKDTLMINILPGGAGWLIICYSKSVSLVIFGRFLCGISCGLISVTVPVYCVEIATAEVRGLLGSFTQGFLVIGHLLCVTLGAFISWNYLALHGAVLCLIATVCFFSMPETPRWLIMKNRLSEAVYVTKRLQNDFIDAEKECDIIYQDIKNKPKGNLSLVELTRSTVLKPTFLGIAIMLFYEFSGANAVFLYSSSIFEIAKNFMDPKISTIILAVVQVVATIISNFIIDKTGRKVLLKLSGSFMAFSLAIFGTYYYKSSSDPYFENTYIWIPLVSLITFIIAFSIGYGPVPHLLVAELLPVRVRSTMSALVQICNGLFAFIVTNTFSDLEKLLGNYGAFWFYASVNISGVIFVHFFIPETKGRRLEDIENLFRKQTKKEDISIYAIT